MMISKAIFGQEVIGLHVRWACLKMSVQQGRSPFLRAERTGIT